MKSNPWIMGTVWAAASAVLWTLFMTPRYGTLVQGLFTVMMPAVYIGFALRSNSSKGLFQEVVASLIFTGLVCHLLLDNPAMIAIGIALHGVYDCLHVYKIVPHVGHVPSAYPPLCAAYDFVFSAFLFYIHHHHYGRLW